MRVALLVPIVVAVVAVLSACEVPTPLAPAEPIGEVPTWGTGFTTPTQQPTSMLGTGSPPTGSEPTPL